MMTTDDRPQQSAAVGPDRPCRPPLRGALLGFSG
jgi:hypothetical protein